MNVTRLAPSPTGALHLGNARTFLINWILARQNHWKIILRIEDIDGPRIKSGADQQGIEDLRWLGMDWDEGPFSKSCVVGAAGCVASAGGFAATGGGGVGLSHPTIATNANKIIKRPCQIFINPSPRNSRQTLSILTEPLQAHSNIAANIAISIVDVGWGYEMYLNRGRTTYATRPIRGNEHL